MNRRDFLRCSLALAGAAAIPLAYARTAADGPDLDAPLVQPKVLGWLTIFLQSKEHGTQEACFVVPRGPDHWDIEGGRARYRGYFTVEIDQECTILRAPEMRTAPFLQNEGFPPVLFVAMYPGLPMHFLPGDTFNLKPDFGFTTGSVCDVCVDRHE